MLVDATEAKSGSAILEFARIFGETTCDIIRKSGGVAAQLSQTAQYIPCPRVTGDIGCFVTFHGDYNGLIVLSFDGAAALDLTRAILTTAGLSGPDLPQHFASENARGALGELTNQVVGHARVAIQKRWDLNADANVPVVVPLIGLRALELHAGGWGENHCVRLSLRTPGQKRFHLELAMEASAPVSLGPPTTR